ncbi:MAG: radical SAM protein [Deltaproteobacteria bacterium]|nr:radical SAM protein [Deltaproteobacteria bacterium]
MKSVPGLRTQNGQSKWIPFLKGFNTKDHRTKYHQKNFVRAYRSWLVPYLKSRLKANEFRPILSYLYTDLNCNLNCDYCFSKGKKIPGMPMNMAKDAVDWLQSVGCRVLAYMGGEPLVRKDFIIDLTRYASERGFFVYLPTNGILMDRRFIDEIGEAGISTINLAVDSVNGYNGMPKYFKRIKPQFEYLVEKEKYYGYITFLNINITRKNVEDAMELTNIAHDYGIATDYHICETPLIDYEGYDLGDEPSRFMESDFRAVDELLDWIIEKNLAGYTMVNSLEHLKAMKKFIRNQLQPWPCRAGELSMVIRLDGSFAPCFELYGAEDDWGNIYDGPKFDSEKLAGMKKKTSTRCLSTCNYQVYHYSQSMIFSLQWIAKHAYGHFFGTS